MLPPKIYLFDLGGVIFHLHYQRTYDSFQKLLGIEHEHFFHQLHQPDFFDQYERGEITDHIFLEKFTKFNSKISHNEIINAWNAMLIGIPEHNLLFLEHLAKSSNLFLLSNTNAIHWKKVIQLLDEKKQTKRFYDCFQEVFLSFELGMRKPEEKIYHHCQHKISAKASQIHFIDDNFHNIESAKKCGLSTRLYPAGNPALSMDLIF